MSENGEKKGAAQRSTVFGERWPSPWLGPLHCLLKIRLLRIRDSLSLPTDAAATLATPEAEVFPRASHSTENLCGCVLLFTTLCSGLGVVAQRQYSWRRPTAVRGHDLGWTVTREVWFWNYM
eukprot:7379489-Prymnesium_polylepis.1